MAKVVQPSLALPNCMYFNLDAESPTGNSHVCYALLNSVPGAPRGSTMRKSGSNTGNHASDRGLDQAGAGLSALPVSAAFLLELENPHLPAQTPRQPEKTIKPHAPGLSDPDDYEFKTVEGDSRLRKCFLRQLEVTNLEPKTLQCLEKRITSRPRLLAQRALFVTPKKSPTTSTFTMDPQEESSSAAAARGTSVPNRYEEPQDKIVAGSPKSVSFKTRATTETCRNHEVCYSSQYTRPVTELLTEVLEVRYPVPKATGDGGEELPLLGGEGGGQRCCWFLTLLGYLRWT